MDRRNFLKTLFAAPAVAILPSASAIWLPESAQAELILPPPTVVEAINDGGTLYGYILEQAPPTYGSYDGTRMLVGDALSYFPLDCEVLMLIGWIPLARGARSSGFVRFAFKGSKLALPGGTETKLAASWRNTGHG